MAHLAATSLLNFFMTMAERKKHSTYNLSIKKKKRFYISKAVFNNCWPLVPLHFALVIRRIKIITWIITAENHGLMPRVIKWFSWNGRHLSYLIFLITDFTFQSSSSTFFPNNKEAVARAYKIIKPNFLEMKKLLIFLFIFAQTLSLLLTFSVFLLIPLPPISIKVSTFSFFINRHQVTGQALFWRSQKLSPFLLVFQLSNLHEVNSMTSASLGRLVLSVRGFKSYNENWKVEGWHWSLNSSCFRKSSKFLIIAASHQKLVWNNSKQILEQIL